MERRRCETYKEGENSPLRSPPSSSARARRYGMLNAFGDEIIHSTHQFVGSGWLQLKYGLWDARRSTAQGKWPDKHN